MAKNEIREKQAELRKSVKDTLKAVFADSLLPVEENGSIFIHQDLADVQISVVLKKEKIEV